MNKTDEQARFNQLRLKQFDGLLTEDEQLELEQMMQTRLDEAMLGRIRQEEDAQQKRLQAQHTESEQLATLLHQQAQLLADARRWLEEFDRRNQHIQQTYTAITGEPLPVQ